MKKRTVNLHIDRKQVIGSAVLFLLLSITTNCVIMLSSNKEMAQMSNLCHSSYEYSTTSANSVGQDEFIQYNASLSFSLIPESDIGINADVVMQTKNADFSDSIYWRAEAMNASEIAITSGLAKGNKLRVGSKLFSKSIVDGEIYEYEIVQILPDAVSTRTLKNKSFTDGIIIMGYDPVFADNLSHMYVVFTSLQIDDLSEITNNSFESIVYREDEVLSTALRLLPYVAALLLMSMISMAVLTIYLVKSISHNFKRLLVLGHSKSSLDASYRQAVYCIGVISMIASFAVSICALLVTGICLDAVWILIAEVLLELLILSIVAEMKRTQLWRK